MCTKLVGSNYSLAVIINGASIVSITLCHIVSVLNPHQEYPYTLSLLLFSPERIVVVPIAQL
jgi:hypothetical protein